VPLFVEHGALYIDHLNQYPGPMVRLFWEKLGDTICSLIPDGASRAARVVQKVCYCDGKRLQVFEATVKGTILREAQGQGGIHWSLSSCRPVHTRSG